MNRSDINHAPALPPPLNIEPDFDTPSSTLPLRFTISSFTITLCIIFVSIRMYVRIRIQKSFNLDDCKLLGTQKRHHHANTPPGALLFAAAGFIAYTSLLIFVGLLGDGKHQWNIAMPNFMRIARYVNIVEILYGPVTFCAKYAVLRQLQSLFFSHRKKNITYKAIEALIWANLLFYVATTFLFLFICTPREKIWNFAVEGHCLSHNDVVVTTPAINLLSDVTILLIPIAEVYKLQIPIKTKLNMAAIFAVGLLSVVFAIIRLYYSIQLKHTDDLTWALPPVNDWGLGEIITVILVACLPYAPAVSRLTRQSKI
ncbi:hypothetical protein GQX73_g5706 [Xylaria multiplex]|uniref:Rhodopsin domain-containing protein n=1 Tax=Xylaria multiplex TaxID=323545 RepID=A0A7C8MRS9_9PEZI|nr:hypothetical protein GQX73_g5706 [Xylaria multiplex]